jgi:DNA replication protein DnaC
MRTADQLERFAVQLAQEVGDDEVLGSYYMRCYEACIPRLFWDIEAANITHNKATFQKIVLKYCAKRKKVLRSGYGLILVGDNGVGKTCFISYIMTQMIKRGCSAYYTTLPQLDIDIKRGFGDKEADRRLEQHLNSDFVAIDEIGKEHFKADSYLNTRFELLLKTRHDDGDPTILASNLDYKALCEMYGESVASIWEGRYIPVPLASGDFRKTLQAKARKDLGIS